MKRAAYFSQLSDNKVRCLLCPHECILSPGQRGLCRTRINREGILVAENYGHVVALSMDPVEKKPLYHFNPGSQILSVASYGCNLHCPWCQNWTISQGEPEGQVLMPESLVRVMKDRRTRQIAFTYTEPFMWYEYIMDFSSPDLWKEGAPDVVLVSNGYINPEPLEAILGRIRAVNLDIKAFDESVLRRSTGAGLQTILNNARRIYEAGVHLELTYLIVTGINDEREEIRSFIRWVADKLSPDVPVHFSRYYPAWKWDKPPTSPALMQEVLLEASRSLTYVYGGNMGEEQDTRCPSCGHPVIVREGYAVENRLKDGDRCPRCGQRVVVTLSGEKGGT